LKKKAVTWSGTLAMFVLLVFGAALASAKEGTKPQNDAGNTWTFIVIGDTRDVTKQTATGISPALPALAAAIAKENVKPDFVVHAGDLTNGYWLSAASPLAQLPGKQKYLRMFENFLTAMQPVSDAGIPLYIVRGNHEFGGEVAPGVGVPDLIAAYTETFAVNMPQNGPDSAKGLDYGVVHKSVNCIVTDQYVGSRGTEVNIDIPWIRRQLEQNTSPIVFTFGHSPAFRVTKNGGETEYQLGNNLPQATAFWRLNIQHKVKAYISSHEHFYTRGQIGGVYQIVQGNGGATPFTYQPQNIDPRLTQVFPTRRIAARDMLPGYLVVTVNETTHAVTVTEKCLKEDQIITFDAFTL
jgi:predicted phosphodiesterase